MAALKKSDAVTVSPEHEITIPKEIVEKLRLDPGQVLRVLTYDNRIVLVPARPISEMRGAFPGVDPIVEREPDRV